MRTIQLVCSNPVPGLEDEFNERYSDRHVHEIAFSGNFYGAVGQKVVQR